MQTRLARSGFYFEQKGQCAKTFLHVQVAMCSKNEDCANIFLHVRVVILSKKTETVSRIPSPRERIFGCPIPISILQAWRFPGLTGLVGLAELGGLLGL